MFKKLLVGFVLFFSFSLVGQEEKVETPKIAIKIPLGETVVLENAAITFNKVIEDSRCPKDVTCVWAGQVKLDVSIKPNGEAIQQKEIIFSLKEKTLYSFKNYRVNLQAVLPVPISTIPPDKIEYAILVCEEVVN